MILIPKYKFRSEFVNAKVSTALNGSVLEPGPGTLTTVDTETCLSIIPNLSAALDDQTGVTFGGSNNRCSYADGFSWADFPTGFDFAPFAGQGLILLAYDNVGKAAWAFLGNSAGSGETLGGEQITALSNNGYETLTLSGTDITQAVNSNAGQATAYKQTSLSVGMLVKIVIASYTKSSGADPYFHPGALQNTLASISTQGGYAITAPRTDYRSVVGGAYAGLRTDEANTDYAMGGISEKQVLTPSSTGVLVYKDAGLTVNGWNKPAGFNMNATSYTFGIHEPRSGGKLFFMGGKATPAYGDPGAWRTDAITREVGKLVAFKFQINDVTSAIEFGLDTDKTGGLARHRIRITADTLFCHEDAATGPVVAIPTDGTECVVLFALRAAGCKIYLKCGTGYFEFLWATGTLTTATLYAGISNYSATAFVDFIRGITYRWLSKPLLSDSFTGAAGTMDGRLSDGAGHAETSGIGSGGVIAWAGANGSVDGSGNLVITPTLGEEKVANGTFDVNINNWTDLSAAGGAIAWNAAGKLDIVNTTGTARADQQATVASGVFCRFSVDVTGAGFSLGKSSGGTQYLVFMASGAKNFRSTQTDVYLRGYRGSVGTTTVDNVSLKETTLSTCYLSRSFPTKDVFIEANFTLIAGLQAGVIFGLNEAGTSFGLARLDGTNFILEICESDVWAAAKATVANASVTNVNLKIFVRGSAIWCYVGDVLMGPGPTTTLSAGETANLSGLKVSPFSTDASNTFHSFVVEAIGKNNEHGIIDRYVGV